MRKYVMVAVMPISGRNVMDVAAVAFDPLTGQFGEHISRQVGMFWYNSATAVEVRNWISAQSPIGVFVMNGEHELELDGQKFVPEEFGMYGEIIETLSFDPSEFGRALAAAEQFAINLCNLDKETDHGRRMRDLFDCNSDGATHNRVPRGKSFFNQFAPPTDMVNHPPHYQSDNGVECIDAIRAALGRDGFVAYCTGNVIKYLWRDKSDRLEDMKKAAWYLDVAIKEMDK